MLLTEFLFQQAGGQMNFIPAVPSVSASVSGAPTSRVLQSSQQQQQGGKDRNYLAQQQKLRAMASSIKVVKISNEKMI
jgi:hypothetical protein